MAKMEENRHKKIHLSPPIEKTFLSVLYLIKDLIWVVLASVFYINMAIFKKCFSFMNNIKNLEGKIILITGAGNGLGRELALQLAALQACIVCVDIVEKDNEETVKDVKNIVRFKNMVKGYTCDLTDSVQVKQLAEKIINDFGSVDILISNAGIVYSHNITGGKDEMIEKVMRVNLLSNFWIMRAFLPYMKNKDGHIVFINSLSAIHGMINGCTYSASKFGLLGFMHALEEELRHDPSTSKIKLTSVHPYFIRTNKEFSQFWNLRIKELEVKEASELIINGIRKELKFFSVPGSEVGYWLSTLSRLVPAKLYHIYRDVFYAYVSVAKEGELSLSDVARHAKERERINYEKN